MNDKISPKYQMKLIDSIDKEVWKQFESYKKVKLYIEKWHVVNESLNDYWENFKVIKKKSGEIDLLETLHTIDGETLIRIAIDLGIETPDFIPLIPDFRNTIKSDYQTASSAFEKAFKQIEEHPDIAVGLVNSALESIVKEILKDERIETKSDSKKTLYDLTTDLLKEFQLYPHSEMPLEIRTIGSSLLCIGQSIEKLRSEKTDFHGKSHEEIIIKDPIYTYFVVNAVSTVGTFLISFYKRKFPKEGAALEEAIEWDEEAIKWDE